MNLYDNHADGIRALKNELGDDCPALFFNGALIKILPGGVRLKKENTPGGFSLDSDIQLTCLSADFEVTNETEARALEKKTFKYPGEAGMLFRITTVTPGPGCVQLRINADSTGKL